MNIHSTNGQSITGEQILAAFIKAMRFSDEMDATGSNDGFERSWNRLSAFAASLAMEFDGVAPGLHQQVMGYQMRVNDGENSLRTARQIAEGNAS